MVVKSPVKQESSNCIEGGSCPIVISCGLQTLGMINMWKQKAN